MESASRCGAWRDLPKNATASVLYVFCSGLTCLSVLSSLSGRLCARGEALKTWTSGCGTEPLTQSYSRPPAFTGETRLLFNLTVRLRKKGNAFEWTWCGAKLIFLFLYDLSL